MIEQVATPRSPNARWCWLVFAILLLLGAWLRVHAVLHTQVIEPLRGDALDYYSYALNLNEHGTYSKQVPWRATEAEPTPDAYRAPGYAWFLRPFVVNPPTQASLLQIQLLQAGIGVLTLVLAWWLAWRWLSPGWALLVLALCAVSPHLVNSSLWILTEAVYAPLVLGMLLCLGPRSSAWPATWRWLAFGALLGVSWLVRPTLQYFVLFVVMAMVWVAPRDVRWRSALAVCLGMLLCTAPWLIRNRLALDIWQDGTLARDTLRHGMYPDFMLDGRPETLAFPYTFDPITPTIAGDAHAIVREIGKRAATDPLTYARWYFVGKPISLFAWNEVRIGDAFILSVSDTPYFNQRAFFATHFVARVLHWPLVVLSWLAMSGLLWRARQWAARGEIVPLWCALMMAYVVAVHVAGAPYPRYSVVFRPETYVLALWLLREGVNVWRERGARA
jgi:4-amino-4-deoxy-L-arabinose transferase-like glycosyltransferase